MDEAQDPPEPVSFLQFDDDVREWNGAAAQADALYPLVVAEHARGDGSFVAHLAQQELDLADAAATPLAPDPVAEPGPAQRAQQRLLCLGGHPDVVGKDGHVGHLRSGGLRSTARWATGGAVLDRSGCSTTTSLFMCTAARWSPGRRTL